MVSMAEQTFRMEIAEKKKVANSARHKKIGSKSKKCTLSSDRLTKKQWEKLNGELINYDFPHPYTWDEFNNLDHEIQDAFLDKINKRYKPNVSMMGKLFGCSTEMVMDHIRTDHTRMYNWFIRNKPTDDDITKFNMFINNMTHVEEITSVDEDHVSANHVDWYEFKKLTDNTQVKFMTHLFKKYNANISEMATIVFGIHPITMMRYLDRYNDRIGEYRQRGKIMTGAQKARLEKFVDTLTVQNICDTFGTGKDLIVIDKASKVDWEAFKSLPRATIINFYKHCFSYYGASINSLRNIFDVTNTPISRHIYSFPELAMYTFGKRVDHDKLQEFMEFAEIVTLDYIATRFAGEDLPNDSMTEDVTVTGDVIECQVDVLEDVCETDTKENHTSVIIKEEPMETTTNNTLVELNIVIDANTNIDYLSGLIRSAVGDKKAKITLKVESID